MGYKFHYGDKVIVHSSTWVRPCLPEFDFVNVCGKVGIITEVDDRTGCNEPAYLVKFFFEGLDPQTIRFCETHLKRAKK